MRIQILLALLVLVLPANCFAQLNPQTDDQLQSDEPYWGPDTNQEPPNDFENQFDLLNYIYSDLYNYTVTNFLPERTGMATRIKEFDGQTLELVANIDDFYSIYTEVTEGIVPAEPIDDFLTIDSLAKEYYVQTNHIPIGLQIYQYDKLVPGYKENNNLFWDNYQLKVSSGLSNEDIFTQAQVAVCSPLIPKVITDEIISFVFTSDFIFTNLDDPIAAIAVNFDDGQGFQEVELGEVLYINYTTPGDKKVTVLLEYESQHQVVVYGVFSRGESDPKLEYNCGEGTEIDNGYNGGVFRDLPQYTTTIWAEAPIDNPRNNDIGTVKTELGIFYGCGNTSCEIRKPFIIVSGFGPDPFGERGSVLISETADGSYYNHYNGVYGQEAQNGEEAGQNNGANLLYKLRNEGYDVIIMEIENAVDYVQNHVALIEKTIEYVNAQKAINGSKHENVMLGQSMGGISLRYALAKWEKERMQSTSSPYMHHQCRTFISWEGEMQGATIPMGIQVGTWYLIDRLPSSVLFSFFGPIGFGAGWVGTAVGHFGVINRTLNTPAAKQLLTYHYTDNKSNNDFTTHKNILHNSLQQELALLGYPEACRRVAIADGSGIVKRPIGVSGGDCLIDLNLILPSFLGYNQVRFKMQTENVNQNQEVFRGRWRITGVPVPGYHKTIEKNYPKAESLAPGSFDRFYNGIFYNYLAKWYPFSCKEAEYRAPFVPTTTVFDIQDDFSNNYNYNMQTNDLFWSETSTQEPNFGYPHIKGVQHKTPFHSVYAPTGNEFHCQNPPVAMANFVLLETALDHLELQNRIIEGQVNEVYTSIFEARETLEVGNDVTEITSNGDFIIDEYTDVELHSPKIILKDGFHVKAGSKVLIQANNTKPNACFTFLGFEDDERTNKTSEEELAESTELTARLTEYELLVYPNPSSGLINIQVGEFWLGAYTEVFDVSGRLISMHTINELTTTLQLPRGMYMLRVLKHDQIETQKIIIQ